MKKSRARIQQAAGNAKLFTLCNFKNYDSRVAEIARHLGLDSVTFEAGAGVTAALPLLRSVFA